MSKKRQINIQLDDELYQQVRHKCKNRFGIGISPLIKIFLKSFVTQRGVGFYVGDEDLCELFARWLSKKQWEKGLPKNAFRFPQPRLKDLYELSPRQSRRTMII